MVWWKRRVVRSLEMVEMVWLVGRQGREVEECVCVRERDGAKVGNSD